MKLTPFYLFILLLIVLVISIIFGYNNNVFEGATTMAGSTQQSSVQQQSFPQYSSSQLYVLLQGSSTYPYTILYDNVNGNLIVYTMNAVTSTPSMPPTISFDVILRNGNTTSYNTSTSSTAIQTLQSATYSPITLTSTNQNWAYGNGPIGILYATWNSSTFIYLIDNTAQKIITMFTTTYDGTNSNIFNDTSINGTPLTTTVTNQATSAQNSGPTTINNTSAYQITPNIFFSSKNGLAIKTNSGVHISSNLLSLGSIVEYDAINSANAISTTFMINNTINTIVNAVAYSTDATSPYSIFTTARISNTGGGNSGGGNSGGGNSPANSPSGNSGNSGWNNNPNNPGSNVIYKTEIVPPVCPAYPLLSGQCNLSVDGSGNVVDCNGNIIIPVNSSTSGPSTPSPSTPSPSTPSPTPTTTVTPSPTSTSSSGWSNFGGNVSNAITGTASTVGGVANTAIGTAGNLVSNAGQDVTNLATGLGSSAANIVTGISSDVTGLIGGLGQNATSLGNNVINSTTGLISGAGNEMAYLVNNAAYNGQAQGQSYGYPYMYGYPYAYGQVQGQGYNQGYGQSQGPVYSQGYGQGQQGCGCNPQYPASSNFMPITNDFSQFAK